MDDQYGAIRFGEFRKYMANKQAKLKDQEKLIETTSSQDVPKIFEGLSVYINGYTNPPQNELRRLIILHGGDYQHYLKKSSVTHIIASNLTQAKCNEFRAYKVVKPNWLTDSIKQQRLLPWADYRITGKDTAQTELHFRVQNQQQQQQEREKGKGVENENATESPQGKILNASLLANQWNRENTTVTPGFVKKFYSSSRLHHLSTWKSEIKTEIIRKLDAKFARGSKKRKREGPRIVMHVDFDCFFASVGLLDRPQLKDKPVAVSHVQQAKIDSSSDIASCNYIARSFGVRNGMHIGTAKRLCPDLQVIPYEFEKYKAISEAFYEVLYGFANEIEPVSVDEALIEVSDQSVATEIRRIIREKTRCEVSIGIGSNILLARLATKKAKPAGQYYCSPDQVQEFSISDLPRVGYAMTEKLASMGVSKVSDLLKRNLGALQTSFGSKTGQMLYNYARGLDDRPLKHDQERQSVSADVNWGVRFENEEQVKRFMDELAEEVSERLRNIERKGKRITLNVLRRRLDAGEAAKRLGCGECDSFSKSVSLATPTDDHETIAKHSYDMLLSYKFDVTDLRGLGILVTKLDSPSTTVTGQQKLSFSPSRETSPAPVPVPVEIDPEVFAELPSEVQDELRRQYRVPSLTCSPKLSRARLTPPIKSPTSHAEQQMHVHEGATFDQLQSSPTLATDNDPLASLPDIPPWSQLDPASLLALPDVMREQVLRMYSKQLRKPKQQRPRSSSPPPQPVRPQSNVDNTSLRGRPRITKRSTRSASPSKKVSSTTLTQMFNPTKSPHRAVAANENLPWESSIWGELPASMQAEIQADHMREQLVRERTIRNDHFREARTKLMDDASEPNTRMNLSLPVFQEPKLLGKATINDVRSVLREWVKTFPEGPELEDENVVANYVLELVQSKDLEKVQLTVMYLDQVTKQMGQGWHSCAERVRRAASDATHTLYSCSLRF